MSNSPPSGRDDHSSLRGFLKTQCVCLEWERILHKGNARSRRHFSFLHSKRLKNAERLACAAMAAAAVLGAVRSARASSIDWDPGNTQAGLSDGSGNWDAETADWYNPGLGSPDVVWNDPNIDSAVIGAGSAVGTF